MAFRSALFSKTKSIHYGFHVDFIFYDSISGFHFSSLVRVSFQTKQKILEIKEKDFFLGILSLHLLILSHEESLCWSGEIRKTVSILFEDNLYFLRSRLFLHLQVETARQTDRQTDKTAQQEKWAKRKKERKTKKEKGEKSKLADWLKEGRKDFVAPAPP